MNIDYAKAAEQDVRNLPLLKKSIATLEKRRDFLIAKGGGHASEIEIKDPYLTKKTVNNALNETLALAEISAEIISARHDIEMIEKTLQDLPKDERDVLTMLFMHGLSAEKISEKMHYQSVTTVYNIRNRGIYNYCVLYYGVTRI